uniref:Uncharacterized protein n=1 Tax=Pipistrellus kuhlii TaxID=59472 RepID=A0A7J7U9U2_PIPKU|nr:hypothetical protein mPipKuh1_009157 [Pipistrellus kuhlii]
MLSTEFFTVAISFFISSWFFFISWWFLLILSNLSSILFSHLMTISLNSCSDRLLASNLFTSFFGDAFLSYAGCLSPMVSLLRMSGYVVLSLLSVVKSSIESACLSQLETGVLGLTAVRWFPRSPIFSSPIKSTFPCKIVQFSTLCLLTEVFNPFTFKVIDR